MNLVSKQEIWLNTPAAQLIQNAKEKHANNWNLALRTVEAVTPVLQKEGEGYCSESGNVQVCLYIALDEKDATQIGAAVVRMEETTGEFVPCLQVQGEEVKDLIAAFLCDFPDALFSIDGGIPVILFVKESQEKLFITLNNMIHCAHQGYTQFAIAIPKKK